MIATPPGPAGGCFAEMRVIAWRARQVWGMVPARHKLALGGALAVMALTSLAATGVPLLLGRLVDAVKAGTEQNYSRDAMIRVAATYLLGIPGLVLLREALH